jgi:hypothetical protein
MINRDLIEKSSDWLISAISVDAKTILQRIPVSAIAYLFLNLSLKLHNSFYFCEENINKFNTLVPKKSTCIPSNYLSYEPSRGCYDYSTNHQGIGENKNVSFVFDPSEINLNFLLAFKLVQLFDRNANSKVNK